MALHLYFVTVTNKIFMPGLSVFFVFENDYFATRQLTECSCAECGADPKQIAVLPLNRRFL